MTDPRWIEGLRQQVANANARTISTFTNVELRRQKVAAQLDRVIAKLDRNAVSRERDSDPHLHARVVAALRQRNVDALTAREQRYAAKQFAVATVAEMQHFLAARPARWRAFAAECFRQWDAFNRVAERSAYTRLLCIAPASVGFLHQTLQPQVLAAPGGPMELAKSLRAVDLTQALRELQQRGFEPSWAFSAIAVANWMYLRVQQPHGFEHAWHAVATNRTLEAMLLPPLADRTTSWFGSEPRSARVRNSLEANATFVAALIRGANGHGAEAGAWNAFTANLLRSTFGDPRMPPESHGWVTLKQRDELVYRSFLEFLITEDLNVFFDHAMTDPRRKEFWLGYLKSVRRTVCILNPGVHRQLKAQLTGADAKLSAAISRARTFRSTGAGAQAFCLYFDSIVVVEFSSQGNAAYVYERAVFEKNFEGSIYQDRVLNHLALKSKNMAQGRILHMGESWEVTAADLLTGYSIVPDE